MARKKKPGNTPDAKQQAEAIHAEIMGLKAKLDESMEPARAAMSRAEAGLDEAVRFVEGMNQHGSAFMTIDDTNRQARMIHGALRIADLLLMFEGEHLEPEDWGRVMLRSEELYDRVDRVREGREALAVQMAEQAARGEL